MINLFPFKISAQIRDERGHLDVRRPLFRTDVQSGCHSKRPHRYIYSTSKSTCLFQKTVAITLRVGIVFLALTSPGDFVVFRHSLEVFIYRVVLHKFGNSNEKVEIVNRRSSWIFSSTAVTEPSVTTDGWQDRGSSWTFSRPSLRALPTLLSHMSLFCRCHSMLLKHFLMSKHESRDLSHNRRSDQIKCLILLKLAL